MSIGKVHYEKRMLANRVCCVVKSVSVLLRLGVNLTIIYERDAFNYIHPIS